MRHLGMKMMSMSEFEKSPAYPDAVKARDKFLESRKQLEEIMRSNIPLKIPGHESGGVSGSDEVGRAKLAPSKAPDVSPGKFT